MASWIVDEIVQELKVRGSITFEDIAQHEDTSAQQAFCAITYLIDNHVVVDAHDGTFVLKGGVKKLTRGIVDGLCAVFGGAPTDDIAIEIPATITVERGAVTEEQGDNSQQQGSLSSLLSGYANKRGVVSTGRPAGKTSATASHADAIKIMFCREGGKAIIPYTAKVKYTPLEILTNMDIDDGLSCDLFCTSADRDRFMSNPALLDMKKSNFTLVTDDGEYNFDWNTSLSGSRYFAIMCLEDTVRVELQLYICK